MSQPSLFGPPNAYGGFTPPLAGRTDPVTSHTAAARVAKSERAGRHRDIVLSLIRRHPGSTGHELWAMASAEEQRELENYPEVYRKANDLRRAGPVRHGEPRKCTVRGSLMVTWHPVSASPEQPSTIPQGA
jgi:hypothetical protein